MRKIVRPLLRVAAILAMTLVVLIVVLVVRTLTLRSRQLQPPALAAIAVEEAAAAERLAAALAIETDARHPENFHRLHEHLKISFPRTRAALTWETVGETSLLLTWNGSDADLPPSLLLAHLDVVPAQAHDGWSHPPFAKTMDDSLIWGRGALDDKASVSGILEAVESLLRDGFTPRRTVLVACGADEEVGGKTGARRIAALLADRKIRPVCVLDEGSFVLEGVVPGLNAPVAPVGVAEKGYADVVVTVHAPGGHSSMPQPHTAIGLLAQAVARIEEHPCPARLDGLCGETLATLGPELPFLPRIAFANLWLFSPVLKPAFARSPPMNALMRSTQAVTLIDGGVKDNVLPTEARALINFRIAPGASSAAVLRDVRAQVHAALGPDKERNDGVSWSAAFADPKTYAEVAEPSAVSPTDAVFATLARTIRQTFPNAIVTPYVVTAATDARHYRVDILACIPLSSPATERA